MNETEARQLTYDVKVTRPDGRKYYPAWLGYVHNVYEDRFYIFWGLCPVATRYYFSEPATYAEITVRIL